MCKCRSSLPCPDLTERGARAAAATLFLPRDPTNSAPLRRVTRPVAATRGSCPRGRKKGQVKKAAAGPRQGWSMCIMGHDTTATLHASHTPRVNSPLVWGFTDMPCAAHPRPVSLLAVGSPPVSSFWLEPLRLGSAAHLCLPERSPAPPRDTGFRLQRQHLPETPHRKGLSARVGTSPDQRRSTCVFSPSSVRATPLVGVLAPVCRCVAALRLAQPTR